MISGKLWTPHEIAVLINEWHAGATLLDMTAKLPGRTKEAIAQRASELVKAGTINRRPIPEASKAKATAAWREAKLAELEHQRARNGDQRFAQALSAPFEDHPKAPTTEGLYNRLPAPTHIATEASS